MRFYPDIHHRQSIRLRGFDYASTAAYFVTVCTWRRECLFGEIENVEMRLNEFGETVVRAWHELPEHYSASALDEFIVMTNHIHGIIWIRDDVGAGFKPALPERPTDFEPSDRRAGLKPAPTPTPVITKHHALSEIVRALKTFSARHINTLRQTPGLPVWQRNYYEHIIRDDDELNRIRQYTRDNPKNWENDPERI